MPPSPEMGMGVDHGTDVSDLDLDIVGAEYLANTDFASQSVSRPCLADTGRRFSQSW